MTKIFEDYDRFILKNFHIHKAYCVPLAFGKHPRTQMNTSATNFVIDVKRDLLFLFFFLLRFFCWFLIISFRFLLLVIVFLGSPVRADCIDSAPPKKLFF